MSSYCSFPFRTDAIIEAFPSGYLVPARRCQDPGTVPLQILPNVVLIPSSGLPPLGPDPILSRFLNPFFFFCLAAGLASRGRVFAGFPYEFFCVSRTWVLPAGPGLFLSGASCDSCGFPGPPWLCHVQTAFFGFFQSMFLGQDGHLPQASPAWSLGAWTDFHGFLPPPRDIFLELFFHVSRRPRGKKKSGPFL